MKRKMKTCKTALCTLILTATLLSMYPTTIIAQDENALQNDHDNIALTSTETTDEGVEFGPAAIEDGAVYAMQNVGTGLWASTRGSTDVNGISNVFQYTSWSNNYQTFTFEKTDTAL